MQSDDVARRYYEAWNRHDAAAIVAVFAQGGTYSDPATEGALTGSAIGTYADSLFAAFPDVSFESRDPVCPGDGMVAAQWVMKGVNSGPFHGIPATGRAVTLPGADFIHVEDGRIRALRGYFDRRDLVEQLGLRVAVQPDSIGPLTFGTSVHLHTGKRTRPGAFSLTHVEVRSPEEAVQARDCARRILIEDMSRMPGFIGVITCVVGTHMFTIAAWEDAEAPRGIHASSAHGEAMAAFLGRDLGYGGHTGVWVPHRFNPMWVRCPACGRMADYERQEGTCECSAALPDPPPYW